MANRFTKDNLELPHFAPKAKRIIYLFQNGAPSHVDLFDYKPALKKWHGTQIPDEIVGESTHSLTDPSPSKSTPEPPPHANLKTFPSKGMRKI